MSDLEETIVILSVYNFGPEGVRFRTATVNKHRPVYNLKALHTKTVYEINIAVTIKEKKTYKGVQIVFCLNFMTNTTQRQMTASG